MARKIFILIGWIGSLIILYGLLKFFGTTPPKLHSQLYYFIGAIALLVTAIYFRMLYFIALQLILIAGHAAILLGSGPYTQFFLPILMCCQLLTFYLMFGKENSVFLILGVFGIALLSMGFAYNDKWIFFSGSTLVAVYAYYSGSKGLSPSYIWAILNTVIALLALYRILFV
ncbi:hypothetical protein LEAN103870_13215 [Legionella anisa]|uniref:Lysoplasmalogenase n=1 Tax=Legionella anisa TaxID=28082 RepID=A0AAX0WU53_9GAMM|nr:hypothetical protein [Legionella anisa]AWN74201.1 hypothetical protein DLD14_10310 [Legionella anisa]KTC72135.1 hypothetical protein Lani_1727 [Legionella anisa]MBN5934358.1 hypothetical protein [Legionella anisa]MCW8425767.1 hypothetical protein [Legionella anisa]MCW8448803.1 hypothetical protein [Legionella anisa]